MPAPTSAFLSGAPPGARLYAVRSSAGREASERGPTAGRGRAVSGRVCLFNVAGTISGGR